MMYVSIRIPDPGPFSETLFDASCRAIVSASFVNSPSDGYVETVLTLLTHFFGATAITDPHATPNVS
jgi:hypothetical protein